MSDNPEKIAEELGGTAEEIKYTIRWTIKLLPPGGVEPEFVTMEMQEDSYIAYQIVKRTKEMLLSDGYTEVQIVGKSRGVPRAPSAPQKGGDTGTVPIGKYKLSKERSDWFKLELYGFFDDGGVHGYPDVTYYANTENMWNMAGGFMNNPVEGDLPLEGDVSWIASWKYGREKKTKPGEHYMDLVGLAEAK